jgi:ABC-type Mn2+/Zn2+ transport system ATPase subunit
LETAIDIKRLNVSYDQKIVLKDVNISIQKGKITGIVGPNGAGKSTLFKSILGLLEPNTGTIKIEGSNIESTKKRTAYVPQKDGVNWEFPATVYDVVLMGRYPHKKLFQSMNKADYAKADQALESLGISDFKSRQIGELSGGQQQRVFIARALCQEAQIILLDEPFVGVDIKTEHQIIGILKDLVKAGNTILIIHHDLGRVKEYFDDIILLNKEIIAFGNVDSIFTKENVNKAYDGRLSVFE